MLSPEAVRERLRAAWMRNRFDWLAGGGKWPRCFSTQPPHEEDALAQWHIFDAWLAQWRAASKLSAGQVQETSRNWKRIGAQEIPHSWSFTSPEDVAAELGERDRWRTAHRRFGVLADWSETEHWHATLSRDFDLLADLSEADFGRLQRVARWLLQHPCSNLYLRQLPIEDVDTKWAKSHRATLARWVAALRGGDVSGDFYAVAGLRDAPDTLRLRLLDPALRSQWGGLSDLQAPVADLAALRLSGIQHVLIVENLYTCLSMGDLPGTVLFMGRGNAIEAFAQLTWLAPLPISYWGDLDADGLFILNRLRGYLPQVRSLLMDAETLHAFKNLWVRGVPHAEKWLSNLTDVEQQLYQELCRDRHGIRVRLEQERVAWKWAWERLVSRSARVIHDGSRMA
jgi:hypothetical protein